MHKTPAVNGKDWFFYGTVFLYLAASILFGYSSFIRHQVFRSSFDLAIFAQAVWNVWTGPFLYSSIKGGNCLLGDHVSPILVLFSPFFLIWRDALALLGAQVLIVTSAVFPIYLIAKNTLESKKLAFLFVVSFLFYSPFRNSIRFDFHPETIAIPLFLWVWYFGIQKRWGLMSLFLFLIILTKETAALSTGMFGLYLFFFERKRKLGFFWSVFSALYFYLAIKVIAPFFSGEPYFYLGNNYLEWKEKGMSAFLSHLFQLSTLSYLKKIFLPVGLLSFFAPPAALLTLPALAQNLLAQNPMTRSTYFHYTAFLTPFVFISAIVGMSRFPSKKVRAFFALGLIFCTVIFSSKSEFNIIRSFQKMDNEHFAHIRSYLKTVPKDKSVRTHEFFAPHLFDRKELHIFENRHPREGGSAKALGATLVIVDDGLLGEDAAQKRLEIEKSGYRIIHEKEGFHVYERHV